jgi:D-sedoheptulose 7-phosphate isomerase
LSLDSKSLIALHLERSVAALAHAADDPALLEAAHAIAKSIISALQDGKKLLIIGNGGSAADAQHIAAEIVGRYKRDRPGYAAIALTTDTSALTSVANDYGFEQIFARQIEGLGQRGDVLLALSTSGKSPNILAALRLARERGLITIAFTGTSGATLRSSCNHILIAPTDETAVVQQVYLAVAHGICDEIELTMMRETPAK